MKRRKNDIDLDTEKGEILYETDAVILLSFVYTNEHTSH